jgi:hypothetical protein
LGKNHKGKFDKLKDEHYEKRLSEYYENLALGDAVQIMAEKYQQELAKLTEPVKRQRKNPVV